MTAASDITPALTVEAVSHTYGTVKALDGLFLAVQPGEIFGLLGPNGSGKSTLFKLLTTIASPQLGKVTIHGVDVAKDPKAVRKLIGVVFQNPAVDKQLTARENITCHAHLYGLSGTELREKTNILLNRFDLADRADDLVNTFSGGMRRKVELAKAVITEPKLLILDEPSTGLDVGARIELWNILEELQMRNGMTIVLTTHLMDEADRCDRLAVLDKGKLLACDTPDLLKDRVGGDVITFKGTHLPQLKALVEERFQIPVLEVDGYLRIEKPLAHLFIPQLISTIPGMIDSIAIGRPTLDDVFIQLTGRRLRSGENI